MECSEKYRKKDKEKYSEANYETDNGKSGKKYGILKRYFG